jgi:hypothetical protein
MNVLTRETAQFIRAVSLTLASQLARGQCGFDTTWTLNIPFSPPRFCLFRLSIYCNRLYPSIAIRRITAQFKC